jgi:hypothetical protein
VYGTKEKEDFREVDLTLEMNLVRIMMRRTSTGSIRAIRWTAFPWSFVSGETRLDICSIVWLLDTGNGVWVKPLQNGCILCTSVSSCYCSMLIYEIIIYDELAPGMICGSLWLSMDIFIL